MAIIIFCSTLRFTSIFRNSASAAVLLGVLVITQLAGCTSSIKEPPGNKASIESNGKKVSTFNTLVTRLFTPAQDPDLCEIDHNDVKLVQRSRPENNIIAIEESSLIDNTQPFFETNGNFVRYHPLGNLALIRQESSDSSKIGNTHPIWPSLRSQFRLDLSVGHKRLDQQLNWYRKHPTYMNRVLKRSTPYFHYVLEEIKKRDLPGELALLPIVESAYDPFAYSHGRASGMWQFIPGTGKIYGLKQNWWYDGRRDVIASTEAALNYLEALHHQFDGNWLHALAAYNSGGGTVRKAIRKNRKVGRPTDFWSLKLPKETEAYVPKLLALAKIFATPRKHNITLVHIADAPQFSIIDLDGQIDLALAASLAGISLSEIYRLNPGFNRWATDPDGPHYLVVPITQTDSFNEGLSNLAPQQRIAWKRYQIKRGDSLGLIAQKNHTTIQFLKQINQLNSNRLIAGSTLLIPTPSRSLNTYKLSSTQRQLALQRRQPANSSKVTHTVQSGESFWTIAKQFKVGTRQLAKWNGMAPNDTLIIGQKLVVWTKSASTHIVSSDLKTVRKIKYRVRKGDSLARIAGKFNVSISQLAKWNNIDKRRYLQPGQALRLWVDVTNVSI